MKPPLVSCIMPTANREKYIPFAINYYNEQVYPNKELIIIDDGITSIAHLVPSEPSIHYYKTSKFGSIGQKRNYACQQASGQIIAHWDDDDWHAADWISTIVYQLLNSGADICGLQDVNYYSTITGRNIKVIRQYADGSNPMNWVHGATMAYWKSFWKLNPFKNLNKGEDDEFISRSGGKICIHDYSDGFVCILHPYNTVVREFENPRHKKFR